MNFNKYLPFLLLLALTILALPVNIFAQCEDDETAPFVACHAGLSITGSDDGGVVLWAQDLDAGSNDNCTEISDLVLRIALSDYTEETPPETSSIELPEGPGTYFIRLWVIDEAGNWGVCFSAVSVLDPVCSNDSEAPQATCTNTEIHLGPSFPNTNVTAASLGLNSTDNCDLSLSFNINLAGESTSPTGETDYSFTEAGVYELDIWAIDDNDNFSSCVSVVTIHEFDVSYCENDDTAPVAVCTNNLLVGETMTLISAASIDNGSYDNCTSVFDLRYRIELLEDYSEEVPPSSSISVQLPSNTGQHTVVLWVGDESDNWGFCLAEITVDAACEGDTSSPTAACIAVLQVAAHPTEGITIFPQDVDAGSFDNCSALSFELTLGDEYEGVIVDDIGITFPPVIETYNTVLTVSDTNGNTSTCWSAINVIGFTTLFEGQVFLDDNNNCTLDSNEENTGFEGWKIRATNLNNGITTDVFTNEGGYYQLNFIAESLDNIQLEVILPNGLTSTCNTSVVITDANGEPITQNFAIESVNDCNYLTVDVATFYLRRCFQNAYAVNYSNYSNFEVANARIVLTLDSDMTMVGAALPYTEQEDGSFLFELGNIPATSGGNFTIDVNLSCDAELGATHCVQAQISPFDCVIGDYAELKVEGECDEILDQVRFKITNIGAQATTQSINAIIVEDVIMNMQAEPIDLDAGQSMEFSFPANGATWRYEVDQDPSFPYGGIAASFVEGCGGFTPNVATLFSLSNSNPNISYSCQENVGFSNSNSEQVYPIGYSEEHIIEANTPVEYIIRFHNDEATSTAIVECQLSEWLDVTTLRPGASNLPYRLEQKENGLLLFHFENNLLTGAPIFSNGFVKFSISQALDIPLGTVIESTANIHFDSDDVIVTNTVFNTIGEYAITVGTQQAFIKDISIEIHPNPLHTNGLLVLNNYNPKKGNLQFFDLAGRLIKETKFSGNQVALSRKDFTASGIYFFRITDQGQLITQGKLIVN